MPIKPTILRYLHYHGNALLTASNCFSLLVTVGQISVKAGELRVKHLIYLSLLGILTCVNAIVMWFVNFVSRFIA